MTIGNNTKTIRSLRKETEKENRLFSITTR